MKRTYAAACGHWKEHIAPRAFYPSKIALDSVTFQEYTGVNIECYFFGIYSTSVSFHTFCLVRRQTNRDGCYVVLPKENNNKKNFQLFKYLPNEVCKSMLLQYSVFSVFQISTF